jgi:hypothetical protein
MVADVHQFNINYKLSGVKPESPLFGDQRNEKSHDALAKKGITHGLRTPD